MTDSTANRSSSIATPSDIRRMFSVSSNDGTNDQRSPPSRKVNPSSPLSGGGSGSDICAKCESRVYQVEKVGPVNKVVFHKGCFKCSQCGQNLTIKTYFTNPLDSSDNQLYCGKHCPKVASQGIDASAIGIRAALKAPNPGLQSSMNDVVRWYGDVPKIDLDARHIREALLAQSEFDKKCLLDNRHHFPVWMGRTKKKLLRYQEELERRQREEEDRLVKAFHDERIKETQIMDKEINEEWQVNLTKLAEEYEAKGRINERSIYDKEVDELTKTMTIKKASKMQALTLRLRSKAQDETADMVKKHSQEMLTLLQAKHMEFKNEIEKEIKSVVGEDPDAIAEALTVMEISTDVPDPHPPRIRKRDLYKDPSVFSELDEEVFKVAESEQCLFTELVDLLTEHCISDLQKARAIFRWITVKDLNVMEFSETVKQETPLGLLRGIKYGTETYHSLFMRLCSYAGIVCKEVKGHSKSVGYEPGMKILSDTFLNSWNVILIAGDWWPVQCNWAARHLVINRNPEFDTRQSQNHRGRSHDKIRYEYDEHYFLTDPDEFVMEFLAHNPKWQLLEVPLSLEEFISMPFVRSIFFHNGLEFSEGCKRAILETNTQGHVEVKLNIPNELKDELVFHYHLRFADREKRRETQYNGISLERHVFHTISDQLALFSVHVPIPSHYFIEIFVSRVEEIRKFKGQEYQASLLQSFRLKCAAKMKIICSAISSKMIPLPACAPGEWGPLKARRYFGIVCLNHQAGVINAIEKIKICLQLKKWMTIRAEMNFNGLDKKDLESFIGININDDLVVTVNAVFPRKGQFGIDIYGMVDAQDDSSGTLTHIGKFLVNCTHVSKPVELPRLNSTDLRRQSSVVGPGYSDHGVQNEYVDRGRSMENEYTMPPYLPSYVHPSMTGASSMDEYENISNLNVASMTLPVTLRDLPFQTVEDDRPLTPGPTPAFQLYGIKCVSHKSPEISDFDKQGGVVIEMACSSSEFKLVPKLIKDSPKENWTHQVSMKDSSKRFKFQVSLPRHGRFWFIIFAVNKNEPQSRRSEVYTYVLNYNENASVKRKTSSLRK